jgi:hypothetical protein
MTSFDLLPDGVNQFISTLALPNLGTGCYRYSLAVTQPTLYSSCYAAMTLSLLNGSNPFGAGELLKESGAWAAFLNTHQDDDGLYHDPVIFDQGWYKDDPLWCGRPHLSCHIITALTCLGSGAPKFISWLDPWRNPDYLVHWLEERDWGEHVGWTGNEIMNIGTLLQYARDFHNDPRAGKAVEVLLDWLATHHLNPETGVWGDMDTRDAIWRSHAVQAAYHWWTLFFYDNIPIPHLHRAIDTLLATQNSSGGFGWGVHNPAAPFNSSACEDIDSIDPLCRMFTLTDYRRDDISAALTQAVGWIMRNQVPEGGFVFILHQPFEYGHRQLYGEINQGAFFPTWFRMLSLALISQALPDHPLARIPWHFVRCPGMQYWRKP